jgi:hypothetical protein
MIAEFVFGPTPGMERGDLKICGIVSGNSYLQI